MEAPESRVHVDYGMVNRIVLSMLEPPTRGWYMLFFIALGVTGIGAASWLCQSMPGVCQSGENIPVAWGLHITNFVFWIGIAHAGTLLSALLYLLRTRFRMPIFRIAEAMTVFALLTAVLFPLLHVGRPWSLHWLIPYPNERNLWPDFRSPFIWDLFAESAFFTVSAGFLALGLIPDLAAARDGAKTRFRRALYALTSVGWSGTDSQWKHLTAVYIVIAALLIPLAVSADSIVSWVFAVSIVPGWHSTIFPVHFASGAILSGVAMTITLSVPIRHFFHLELIIKHSHFEAMAKILMATSLIVAYSCLMDFYTALSWADNFEKTQFLHRPFGPYAAAFWIMLGCTFVVPLSLWLRRYRTNIAVLFAVSILVNVGMWFERFNTIAQSLSHDYLPSTWGYYSFSWSDLGITIGGFGWFSVWILLFVKFFPVVSGTEIKRAMPAPRRGNR